MIPLTLQIKNFLSYGPTTQTIDFSSHHLICFSGKNGHGKSALLDAMTWAIWGQARKISNALKADAHLLHLGQTQMMVCLDFLCNGQQYRVRREYAKTYGKPLASLDFGLVDQKDGSVFSLSDKTIRATQKVIEQTIHLTFDAFINSAFLRQGQANEFSKKSPKDRKEIFAQILGLQKYEAVRKRAVEIAKEASAKKAGFLAFQEKIAQELEKRNNIETEIKELKKQLLAITHKETTLSQEQKKIQTQKTALSEQQKKVELIQFQINELCKQEIEQQKRFEEIRTTWKKIQQQQIELFLTKLQKKQF